MSDDNVWPALPGGFCRAVADYHGKSLRLTRRLIRVFAQALDLQLTTSIPWYRAEVH